MRVYVCARALILCSRLIYANGSHMVYDHRRLRYCTWLLPNSLIPRASPVAAVRILKMHHLSCTE
jgi:hypothetical protein